MLPPTWSTSDFGYIKVQYLHAALQVWRVDMDLGVEASRSQQGSETQRVTVNATWTWESKHPDVNMALEQKGSQ